MCCRNGHRRRNCRRHWLQLTAKTKGVSIMNAKSHRMVTDWVLGTARYTGDQALRAAVVEESASRGEHELVFGQRVDEALNWWLNDEYVHAPGQPWYRGCSPSVERYSSHEPLFKADATFRLRPGLADPGLSSLESYNYPGYYIRHKNFQLRLEANADAPLFKKDATFLIRAPHVPSIT